MRRQTCRQHQVPQSQSIKACRTVPCETTGTGRRQERVLARQHDHRGDDRPGRCPGGAAGSAGAMLFTHDPVGGGAGLSRGAVVLVRQALGTPAVGLSAEQRSCGERMIHAAGCGTGRSARPHGLALGCQMRHREPPWMTIPRPASCASVGGPQSAGGCWCCAGLPARSPPSAWSCPASPSIELSSLPADSRPRDISGHVVA